MHVYPAPVVLPTTEPGMPSTVGVSKLFWNLPPTLATSALAEFQHWPGGAMLIFPGRNSFPEARGWGRFRPTSLPTPWFESVWQTSKYVLFENLFSAQNLAQAIHFSLWLLPPHPVSAAACYQHQQKHGFDYQWFVQFHLKWLLTFSTPGLISFRADLISVEICACGLMLIC